MIYTDLIRTGLNPNSSQEIIELLADILKNSGYVNSGFKEAVIEREKKHPTGLSTGETGFAIPHTDSTYVVKSAISIGILNHPVKFGDMGDPKNNVDVDIVIMLAIDNPDKVVSLLKDICTVFQDKALVASLHDCDNPEEVENVLKNRLAAVTR